MAKRFIVASFVMFAVMFSAVFVSTHPSASARQDQAAIIAESVEAKNVVDLRAAVAAGGKVSVKPGRYVFLSPLVLKGTVSIIGDYRDLVTFDFSKMTDPTLPGIQIDRVWGYEIRNLTIMGNRKSNAIGILNSTSTPNANGAYGTCSGQAVLDHIFIYGFKKGIVVGNRDLYIAASENTYNQLKITQCDRCIELNDFNSLNHYFTMLLMGDCNEGLVTNGASYVTVVGGSSSFCIGPVFDLGNCSSAFIKAMRMEEGGVFARCGTTSTTGQFTFENCLMHQRAGFQAEDTKQWVNGWKCLLATGGSSMTTVRNCFLKSTVTNDSPIIYAHNAPGGCMELIGNTCTYGGNLVRKGEAFQNAPGRVYQRNNAQTDGGGVFRSWYADQSQ
jgi:hypothetical protein